MKYICELCGESKEEAITIILPEVKMFYSIQEAFNNQFITHEDSLMIANYKNNVKEEELPTIDLLIGEKTKEDFCFINDINYGLDIEIPGTIRFFGEFDKDLDYVFILL